MQALQKKIDDVEIQHGNAIKSLEERKSDVVVGLKNGRPSFQSADGNFTFEISGRAHLDVGYYDQDDNSEANFGGLGNNMNFRAPSSVPAARCGRTSSTTCTSTSATRATNRTA